MNIVSRYVCIVSNGGIVEDLWSKPTLEEARLSLAQVVWKDFDPETDDARVFEILDDGIGTQVYSFNEADFEERPGSSEDAPSLVFRGNRTTKTYRLPVSWTMSGVVKVEAECLEEAVLKAYKWSALPDGEYVPDSFIVHCGEDEDDEEEINELIPR
ncbi:hypothetical protein [Alicyclobacillus shizuokensis]|uniref:hypothetical protein n=1 Tax=Alicyclobacillus shizuokensis TaxID=392014 RepID=UPI000837653F|nr:hypothetical protein [Alicyclobacillus shizuokensis]